MLSDESGGTMDYLIWKLVHVVSVILFVGNITTGVFWATNAVRSGNFALIASTFDGIIRADRLFTSPAAIGLTVSGIVAAITGGLSLIGTGWVLWGIVLLVVSGGAFGTRIAPLQRELARLAHESVTDEHARVTFRKRYASWQVWGTIALLLPLVAVAIMVLKPVLPAF